MTPAVSPSDDQLRACCAADAWLSRMSPARPFPSAQDALDLSDAIVLGLDDSALEQPLAEGNRRYEERFGHVFLSRAAGRSAEEMLAALEQRIGHDDETERGVVRRELA